jgi:hypothetical protein
VSVVKTHKASESSSKGTSVSSRGLRRTLLSSQCSPCSRLATAVWGPQNCKVRKLVNSTHWRIRYRTRQWSGALTTRPSGGIAEPAGSTATRRPRSWCGRRRSRISEGCCRSTPALADALSSSPDILKRLRDYELKELQNGASLNTERRVLCE